LISKTKEITMKKSEVDTPVVTGDKDTDALLDMERIDQKLPENQVALHSVGSVLDTEVAVVYPMNKDGSADYDSPFCFEDVDEEWYLELSEADMEIVSKVRQEKTCVICGDMIDVLYADGEAVWTNGHNPYPIKEDGRCCSWCNNEKVIPERMRRIMSGAGNM